MVEDGRRPGFDDGTRERDGERTRIRSYRRIVAVWEVERGGPGSYSRGDRSTDQPENLIAKTVSVGSRVNKGGLALEEGTAKWGKGSDREFATNKGYCGTFETFWSKDIGVQWALRLRAVGVTVSTGQRSP